MPETTETKMFSFRLDPEHRQMIDDIAKFQGGLSKTRVVEWAIERLHADVEAAWKKTREFPFRRLDVS